MSFNSSNVGSGIGQRFLRKLRTAARMPIREIPKHILRKSGVILDQQWCRVVMDLETRLLVERMDPERLDALEISGSKWGTQHQFKTYRNVFYPEFDICRGPLADSYDLIIAEQVWEHLLRPSSAARHVYEMLREGGHFLISTPFLLRIHEEPNDCTRWTQSGLRGLLEEAGFAANKIRTNAWGNRSCLAANLQEWKPYNRLLHSLKNESDVPLVVWAIAQK